MVRKTIDFAVLVAILLLPSAVQAGHRFHASAIAVTGDGTPAVSFAVLPPGGGRAESAVDDYDDGVVSFARASSRVSGSHRDGTAITEAEVVITDLSIAGRVHADRVIVRVRGTHPRGAPEAAIVFDGSRIDNLTVDGARIEARIGTSFFAAHPSFAGLSARVAKPPVDGMLTCTSLGQARCGAAYGGEEGMAIPGLGTLYLGEVSIKLGWRQLDMLRLVRDAAVSSDKQGAGGRTRSELVLGSVVGNGTDFGPPP